MEFTEYVDGQRRALLRFATVLTGQPWLADDLVGDVLAVAFERWDRIGALARPHAYLRRMVINDYLSWRRRLQRVVPVAEVESDARPGADVTDEYVERDAMIARLRRLPRRQRAAVVLRYYVDLSDAEIAEELGCRASTVRSQITRAMRTLRVEAEAPNKSTGSVLEER